jgi:RNA-directed DNA polymerase
MERELILVPLAAKQVREIQELSLWAEPSVWTIRMLTALVKGVKGGTWYSLMDKVYSRKNLAAAIEKVKRNKGAAGVDHQTIEMFENRHEQNIENLQTRLKEDRYLPQKIRRKWIPKPGKKKEQRPLGIPTVRDRVVETALRNVIEPIFESTFAEQSYGFRPNRGTKDALRQVENLLNHGYRWVVDADIKSYFDSIPHERLMSHIKEKISDRSVLTLIEAYLNQEVMDTMKTWRPEKGTPQGAVISPLLSNIYLDPLDKLMAEQGYEMVRYADDFVILTKSQKECEKALALLTNWIQKAELQLHPEKTKIVNVEREDFDFLGYHFTRNTRWPSKKSLRNMRDTIRAKTKRTNGHSMENIIEEVNKTLQGWFEYFKHSKWTTFPYIDGWVRMRLRSILRKRHKLKGRGRGKDHQRWPNSYFSKLGLFSLVAAREAACQSARR